MSDDGSRGYEVNVPVVLDAVAAEVPDREAIVFRDRRSTWARFTDRTNRLGNVLATHGLGLRDDPATAQPWESPHDHVATYLVNGPEYLETMVGSWKARAASFNVNYRYVAEELAYLLRDAATAAVVYHAAFAPVLADALAQLDTPPRLLLHVDDDSGHAPLLGAIPYEDALAAASHEPPPIDPSPDDLYVLYTGGTTGMPKGTLWRQADYVVAALGFRRKDGTEFESLGEIVDAAVRSGARLRAFPSPPLIHGAAQWNATSALLTGGTVVLQSIPDRLDPADILDTIERERATSLQIVGDAFARPLLDEQRDRPRDLSTLRFLLSGGATFSTVLKRAWVDEVPGLRIIDVLGSSESGRQGVHDGTETGRFEPSKTAVVLREDLSRPLQVGADEIGWLGQTGRVPRGYLGDADKTARTFPTIDGVRYVVAGDRARLLPDGRIELLGRESVTINTGGEKVFAEEVEHALKHHPSVFDVLVVGRPSERWGQEVVAVVCLVDGAHRDEVGMRAAAAAHVARYKLPKAFVFVDHVERHPTGKPDYAWAVEVAAAARTSG
jgi:fatty-acyl-CoA synthase